MKTIFESGNCIEGGTLKVHKEMVTRIKLRI